ncbi:MAG TPA: peptidoglycan DD-metalloendopeptidase family protein [Actinomycetota bacterium]|nr:peptidoglycan DD-metalloendopeptidase family protein [Actinomycetota bacterium]
MRRLLPAFAAAFCLATAPVAAAQPGAVWLTPPVDGGIAARYDPPERKWGSGHRGVDFAVPAATAVRAAAPGYVVFAGPVAGTLAVTIDHGSAFRTTYSALASVDVGEGDYVDRGHWIGTSGHAHAGGIAGVHLGVKVGERYADPALFLGPVDASAAIYLAPVVERTYSQQTTAEHLSFLRPHPSYVGDHERECTRPEPAAGAGAPPNDNVLVAINGLGSKTAGPDETDLYRHAVDLLRYPAEDVYLFSYEGTQGPRLHEPYRPAATFGDFRDGADKLHDLLRAIARRHPGRDVDLLAHSQGGLVARIYLERLARTWSPGLPRVRHLVTLATPHTGAPAADLAARLEEAPGGALVAGALSRLAHATELFPDPRARSVAQMSPGSRLNELLAAEDVAYGTRVLALSVPDDLAVPAHRARLANEASLLLPPAGGFAHSRIVESPGAAAVAYDFLRDGAPSCPGGWDGWSGLLGRLIEAVEDAPL